MKKLILPSVLILALLLTSCSNSNDDNVILNDPTNTDVSYDATVKSIIDSNCLGCHTNPPINNASMSLITYDNVKDAVINRGLIGRVENGSMPPIGTLTSAQIQAIKDWQTDGFLQ